MVINNKQTTQKLTRKPRIARKTPIKNKLFVREYVSNGQNGAKAYLKINPNASPTTATVNASKKLLNTDIQRDITELLQDNGLNIRDIVKTHKRNMLQDKQLSVSQSAVDTGYKLYGHLNNKDDGTKTNIAIVFSDNIKPR